MTQQLSAVHRWADTLSGFGLGHPKGLGGLSSQVSAMAPVHASMKQNPITTTATTRLNKYYRQFMSRHSSSYSRSGDASSKVDTSCFNQAVSGASPRLSCLPVQQPDIVSCGRQVTQPFLPVHQLPSQPPTRKHFLTAQGRGPT